MKIHILLILLLFTLPGYSQSVFTGVVKNSQKESVTATITIQPKGSTAISGYVSVDNLGQYKIAYNGVSDSLIITVRGLTIEKITRHIPNRSATIDFIVKEAINQLAEIQVKADPVRRRGDTLSYMVSAFSGQSDRVIEDVMKKMPGIEVSPSGTISYNGKSINKFYIEDTDLLDGRYNIATRNITAKDVASVQVFENHQPVKAEKTFSDQAAINLKLKNSAKGVWALSALAGGGYEPALWNAELTAMNFAKNRQHISVYKGNNSGHTAKEELLKKYDSGAVEMMSTGSMLSVSEPGTPSFEEKRYLKNVSNSVSANQLFKINDKELKFNIAYYNERLHKNGYSSYTQYLPNENTPLVVEENMKNVSETNDLDVSLRLLSNNMESFFDNMLNVRTVWSNSQTEAFSQNNREAGNELISQFIDKPYFSISNMLKVLKSTSKQTLGLSFAINYNDRPHQLLVSPVNYFGNDSLSSLSQEVIEKNIGGTLRGRLGFNLGNFSLNYSPRMSASLQKLKSELTGRDMLDKLVPAADSVRNDLWFNNYQVGVDQDYTFKCDDRFKLRLMIPTFLSIIMIDNQLGDKKVSYKRSIVNPTLSASYNFSSSLSASAQSFYQKSYGNFNDVYTGYIMQSYRSLLRNSVDDLFESSSTGSNFTLDYRNAMQMIFLNLGTGYKKSRKNLFYGYNYDGIVAIKTFIDRPTDAESYNVYASASKTFSFWQTKIALSVGFNNGKSELLLQNEVEKYDSKNYSTGLSFNTTPCRYVNLVYDFSWSHDERSIENASEQYPALRNHTHDFKVWIFPNESLSVNFNVDYQYYNEKGNRNMAFADALVRYKYKQTEWELECNNLFNAKQYVSTTYSGMSTYISRYELRPLSFLIKVRFKLK